MNNSKFLFSTLIAAAAMTATAYAEISSELGTLEWTTAPSTGGDFYGGDYGLTFNFTSEVIKTLEADKSYVLAAYWGGSGTDSYGANALVLNYSSSSDTWTLQLGRGILSDTDLTADTTFTFQDSVTFAQTISVDTTYTLSVTGGNQAMTPTLSWGDDGSEALSLYAGNMNGGNASTTMNYGLLNLYYTTDSVWGGGDGSWTDASWTTGSESDQSLGALANVTFNSSATMTATDAVTVNSITLAADQTLTLAGAGAVSSGDLNNSGTIAINSESTLSTTAATTLGTITGSGRLELGTGDATPGSNFTSDTWTGTVAFVDVTKQGLSVSSYGNENSTIAFNGFTGYFAEENNGTIASNIAVEGNLTINDGYYSGTLTFSGEVSGEGTFAFTKGNAQKFAFTNNVDLATMSFTGGSATFTGNTTSIDTLAVNNTTLDFSGTSLTIGRLVNNGTFTHSSGTFDITGTGTGDNGSLNWGTFTIGSSATVNVSADMKISAWSTSNGSQKALVLEDGAKLSVGGDVYNASGVAITNNGGIVTEGTMDYSSGAGWSTNTFGGNGYIIAETFKIGNQTELVLQNHKFIFGALTQTNSKELRFGTATIGATGDWSFAKAVTLTGTAGTEETTTTFNTGAFDSSAGAFSSEDGYSITLSGVLSGAGAIIKDGAGTLTLSGANTYTGDTTISAGTLVAANASALGTGNVSVESRATLSLGTNSVTVKNLSGAGTIGLADGTTTATLTVDSDADSTFSGTITTGAPDNDSFTISLVKTGAGTLTLSEMSANLSTVSINAGSLVAGVATLAGSDVSVADGAQLSYAAGEAAMYANSVEFASGATFVIDLAGVSLEDGADSITLDIIAASAIKFGDTQLGGTSTSTFALLTSSAASDEVTIPDGYVSFANDADFADYTQSWSYADGMLSLTLAIPEPSLFGLLAGLGALTLVGTRRRRR